MGGHSSRTPILKVCCSQGSRRGRRSTLPVTKREERKTLCRKFPEYSRWYNLHLWCLQQGSGYTVVTDVNQDPLQSAIHRFHRQTKANDDGISLTCMMYVCSWQSVERWDILFLHRIMSWVYTLMFFHTIIRNVLEERHCLRGFGRAITATTW